MDHSHYPDAYVADILKGVKTIALVGASPNPVRPSNGVMGFLLSKGYHVIPVNPGQAGKSIHGQKVYGHLTDIEEKVDMVDVFRASEFLGEVVEEALRMAQRPDVIWTQLGVRDDAAAARAEEAGIKVVQDRCPAIEYPRLLGHH
ncbi:CoA-binding protein [Rhizobium helianthi]|uniref:CoA-binding protein n=1 Tax=Rhizobium helianthi TaxID=1132695 RepID=A0ABW4M0F6_9HYPH